MGAMNSVGFSSQLDSGILPTADHITYEGVFNELTFKIGPKAKEPLELYLGYARSANPKSLVDSNPSEYLAIFTKGNKDGAPRDKRILNSVIVIDVSGSMGSGVTHSSKKSRLDLSKEAIKMFVSKLRNDDSFGLVTFNNEAQTVIQCDRKDNLDLNSAFALVDQMKAGGGTTLAVGFEAAANNLRQYLSKLSKPDTACENRIIMLTDVCDNFGPSSGFLGSVSEAGIHTTIVGISDDFKSETCEQLIEIRGFNYFCAIEDDHLKKYMFENFDYTFFPSNYGIQIGVESDNIACFEVFGTTDKKKVNQYNNFAQKGLHQYTITKTECSFPSELEFKGDDIFQHGGLILVKLTSRTQQPSFRAKVTVSYEGPDGPKGPRSSKSYDVHYDLPRGEQFYSEECLEQALRAYYFVSEMKEVIRIANDRESNKMPKEKIIETMNGLKTLAPESKLEEVDKMIKIVQGWDSHK